MQSGELGRAARAAKITGVSVSPRQIEHLLLSTTLYDEILSRLLAAGHHEDAESLSEELIVHDAREAAEVLKAVGGVVSIRLNPRIPGETGAITREAESLWKRIGKPNILIEIPATEVGIRALAPLRSKGIGVRVGGVFSPDVCQRVADAPYIDVPIDPLENLTDALLEDRARSAPGEEWKKRLRALRGHVGAALAEELRLVIRDAGTQARLILSSATPARIPDVPESVWELPWEHAEAEPIRASSENPGLFFEELRSFGISIDQVGDLVREQVHEERIREHDRLTEAVAKKRRELLSDRLNLLSLSLPAELRLIVDEHLDAWTEIEAQKRIWIEMRDALERQRAGDAEEMIRSCAPGNPPRENPGIFLGVILGILLKHGRKNMTVVRSSRLAEIDDWISSLWDPGVLAVSFEEAPTAPIYALDRIFAHFRTRDEIDEELEESLIALHRSGHCVIRIVMKDRNSIAQEFFRWEMAARAARHLLIPEDDHEISLKRRLSRL